MSDAAAVFRTLVPDPTQRVARIFLLRGSLRKAFDLALSRAGIAKGTDPISRVSWHTLRHTAASWLTIRGASLRSVQEILGHSTPTQTARYAHPGVAHLRADLERLAGLVPGARNEPATAHAVAQLGTCAVQVPAIKA